MLTDDDLIRELTTGFREETADVVYRGRTRPPRPVVTMLPAAAAVTALAAGGVVVVLADDGSGPSGGTTAPAITASPAMVTDTVRLAGYTLTYQRPVGAPPLLAAGSSRADQLAKLRIIYELPADAERVEHGGDTGIWIGTDSDTGETLLYIGAAQLGSGKPTRWVVLISSASPDDLAGYVRHGQISVSDLSTGRIDQK